MLKQSYLRGVTVLKKMAYNVISVLYVLVAGLALYHIFDKGTQTAYTLALIVFFLSVFFIGNLLREQNQEQIKQITTLNGYSVTSTWKIKKISSHKQFATIIRVRRYENGTGSYEAEGETIKIPYVDLPKYGISIDLL